MAHVLVLSSWVAFGHVGLCAAAPALQALGHSVTQLPTVQLSNHPGWPRVAGKQVPVAELRDIIGALEANGWLVDVDAVLTGYLPSEGHVDLAAELLSRLSRCARPPRVVVDPVLGDSPRGLYIDQSAAAATRDRLVPMADLLTPNAFELGWLAGREVDRMPDVLHAALALRDMSNGAGILVTSPPVSADQTGVLSLTGPRPVLHRTARRAEAAVPHGVGDVFAALVAADGDVARSLGRIDALIGTSLGAPHLRIAESAATWIAADPIAPEAPAPLTGVPETR